MDEQYKTCAMFEFKMQFGGYTCMLQNVPDDFSGQISMTDSCICHDESRVKLYCFDNYNDWFLLVSVYMIV